MQWVIYWIIVVLIFLPVLAIAVSAQYPGFYEEYWFVFEWFFVGIACLFLAEMALRIVARPWPRDYLLTWEGVVDLVAVIPAFIALFLPFSPGTTAWVRSLRLLRLIRLASLLRETARAKSEHLQILARLAPFFALAFALKAVLLFLEGRGLWPRIEGLETIITIIGFSIGILLSTRLATVHGRIYTFDERIEHLAGLVEAAKAHSPDPKKLIDWLEKFIELLRLVETRKASTRRMMIF